jgi:small subunit ribosomal protein S1
MNDPNPPVSPLEAENLSAQDSESTTDAFDEASFGDILSQFEHEHHSELSGGEIVEGRVVEINDDTAYIDIGRKMEGLLPVAQAREAGLEKLNPGDPVRVAVTGRDDGGYYALSTVKVERPKDWSALEKAFEQKTPVGGVVTEVIKGGLRVDMGVRAFMPASRSGVKEVSELESLVGQDIRCIIIKLDKEKEDVVVDRRAVLEQEAAQAKQERFAQLQEGQIVTGTVRTVTDFGAFIDLGGFDGLLHVTDMSWGRVNKPSDLVKPGDRIEVKILKINRDTHKIGLGLKQLQPDPWTVAADKYKTGDRITGKVVRLTEFGAFVELEPGLDGLIHLSEMSWSKKIRKPSDVVKVGDLVDVVVLGVSVSERRIALGLKQALGDPWDTVVGNHPVGSVVEAPVTSLQKFGAFVDLGNGIDGMIHIGDISRDKRLNHPNEVLKVGQTVKAQVLEIDKSKRRIRLGMKQLEPTQLDEFISEHQSGEVVSGRLVEVSNGRARVELGEGVYAVCRMRDPGRGSSHAERAENAADLSSMTAMLSAKWKSGAAAGSREQIKAGQIRSFRITALDPAEKRIEIELAG